MYQGVYKQRTHETHMQRDLPYIQQGRPVDVVLLGDSHFERLLWFGRVHRHIPAHVQIASVGGDQVEHLLYRLESPLGLIYNWKLHPSPPKRIILMIGANNLSRHTPEEICDRCMYVARLLRESLPQTEIHVWAIPHHPGAGPLVLAYNQLLDRACREQQFFFSNEMYHATRTHRGHTFADHIHLSERGYEDCMLPVLRSAWSL